MTGSGNMAAMTPGRWADPPAPEIITLVPLVFADIAYSRVASNVR